MKLSSLHIIKICGLHYNPTCQTYIENDWNCQGFLVDQSERIWYSFYDQDLEYLVPEDLALRFDSKELLVAEIARIYHFARQPPEDRRESERPA